MDDGSRFTSVRKPIVHLANGAKKVCHGRDGRIAWSHIGYESDDVASDALGKAVLKALV
jgi:hypothetical protein